MIQERQWSRGRGAVRALGALAIFAGLGLAGCDLEISNPNAPDEKQVLTTESGIVALAVGLQDQFASNIDDFVQGPALVTDEWGTGRRSLLAYRNLLQGRDVTDDLGLVEAPWASAYFVIRSANNLIANAGTVGLDPGLATGITALAKLYKGMSLGMVVQQFQQAPVQPGGALASREIVLDSVLAVLESARADAAGANLTLLRNRVTGSAFNLPNTVNAMLARYYLIDGQYAQAITAAQRVDLNSTSSLVYTGADKNPIFNLSVELQYVYPLNSFVRGAETGDQRPAYWTQAATTPFTGEPDSLLVPLARFSTRDDPYPVYVPDEMRLIQAEANARLGRLAEARDLINAVRTQCTSGPQPRPCLAALPVSALDTLDEVLAQIAYERRYELYMQGLRWEDLRRLGAVTGRTPSVNWLPVPRQECQNNPNINCS